jgi:hypothetical protein
MLIDSTFGKFTETAGIDESVKFAVIVLLLDTLNLYVETAETTTLFSSVQFKNL